MKRSWAIADAAKSDPIGSSASRPCVNFELRCFAVGESVPSPDDGHGPVRNSRLGAVAPRTPLPRNRSISGRDQRREPECQSFEHALSLKGINDAKPV